MKEHPLRPLVSHIEQPKAQLAASILLGVAGAADILAVAVTQNPKLALVGIPTGLLAIRFGALSQRKPTGGFQ